MNLSNAAFETIVTHAVAFLLGFIAWRVFEFIELSGARMRHRRALAELKRAEGQWHACALAVRRSLASNDERQRERATLARDLEEARGDNSDRDWLGKKSDAPTIGGEPKRYAAALFAIDEEKGSAEIVELLDQSGEWVAPERGSES